MPYAVLKTLRVVDKSVLEMRGARMNAVFDIKALRT